MIEDGAAPTRDEQRLGDEHRRRAHAVADEHCRRAGLVVAPLDDVGEVHRAAAVLREVWAGIPDAVPPAAMRALAHLGSYVVGLYDQSRDGQLIGASVAFFGAPGQRRLHSHITGIRQGHRGANAGTALKLHQRAWALDRDVDTITWTFDPLVGRNAHLNLTKLGAGVAAYLPNFYGAIDDDINRGDPTDRLQVDWDVTRPWSPAGGPTPSPGTPTALAVGSVGEPVATAVPPRTRQVLVATPRDIETLRRQDPRLARSWRTALRDTLVPLLAAGFEVSGFTASGHYLMEGPR